VAFLGNRAEKIVTPDEASPYRVSTWKPIVKSYWSGTETSSTFTIWSIHSNGHADISTNSGAGDLLALYENDNGMVRAEALEAVSGAYTRNLGTFFTVAKNDSGNDDVFIHPSRVIPKAAYSTNANSYSLLEQASTVPNGSIRIYRDATIGWKLLIRSDANGTAQWLKADLNAAGFDGTLGGSDPPPPDPPGGGSCFSLSKTYLMEEGGILVPLGEIEPGDKILQEGPDGPVYGVVMSANRHDARQTLVLNDAIYATGEHLLFGYIERGKPHAAGLVTVSGVPIGYTFWGLSRETLERRPVILENKAVGPVADVGSLATENGNYYVFGFKDTGEVVGVLAHNLKDL